MTTVIELTRSPVSIANSSMPSSETGSASTSDTSIGLTSPVGQANENLAKIESFFENSTYRETIEYIANFNTRLCLERRQRLPFRDQQTGIGQKHSQLYVDRKHRMPGLRHGQVYTYPAARWRKSRRQYLYNMQREPDANASSALLLHTPTTSRPLESFARSSLNVSDLRVSSLFSTSYTALCNGFKESMFNGQLLDDSSNGGSMPDPGKSTVDSKENHQQHTPQQQQKHQKQSKAATVTATSSSKTSPSSDWYYMNDLSMNDSDPYEEPKSSVDDDEFDYDPRYGVKKRRKRKNNSNSNSNGNNGGGSKGNSGGKKGAGGNAKQAANADGSKKPRKTGGRGRPSNSNNSSAEKSTPKSSTKALKTDETYQPSGMLIDVSATATAFISEGNETTPNGKRPRATTTRGRRRRNNSGGSTSGGASYLMTNNQAMGLIPLQNALHQNNQRHHHQQYQSEPPSFESMAAAVGSINDC